MEANNYINDGLRLAAVHLEDLARALDEVDDEPTARLVRDCAELMAATALRRKRGQAQPMGAAELLAAERAAREEAQREALLFRGANRELRRLLAAQRVTVERKSERVYPWTDRESGKRYRVEGSRFIWEGEDDEGGTK